MINCKGKDNLENQMEIIMSVNGKMIRFKAMAHLLELMEMFFKETGLKIRYKDKELLNLLSEILMMAIG